MLSGMVQITDCNYGKGDYFLITCLSIVTMKYPERWEKSKFPLIFALINFDMDKLCDI